MRHLAVTAALLISPAPGQAQDQTAAQPPDTTVPPMEQVLPGPDDPESDAAFRDWIRDFRAAALANGISAATYDRAMATARYQPDVIARDRNQAEFTRTIGQYLARAVTDKRVAEGQAALATHAGLLSRIADRFGVEPEVVVAVWGMESAYGSNRGDLPVISSLATLAQDGRRPAMFQAQLLAALKILQTGEIAPEALRGSWAGAMGHTQFMPVSWLETAVDFTGDGRRDIWGDDPADALASTAAYLARAGWTRGQPWGIEVKLPQGFDFANSGKRDRRPAADWRALGLTTLTGAPLPDHGSAALLLPAGAKGPALLIHGNFTAIERYNAADAYVIAVGHLADRLAGRAAFQAAWPEDDRALTRAERVELQDRLTAAGFDTGGSDGIIGPNSLSALRAFQKARGLVPDGYPSGAMLDALR